MSATKNIKVQIGQSKNFHRFLLEGDADFAALQEKLEVVAKQVPHWASRLPGASPLLLITYTDDEGDQVQLTDDADLAVALEFGEPLRLIIRPRGNGNPAAAGAPATRGPQVFTHRRISPVHCRRGRCGGNGNGNWHRWALEKYGAAPARRLAAAGGIDCKAAVAKLVAAMNGDAEALQYVDVTMTKATNGNWRQRADHWGSGRCQPGMGQKLFSCRAGPAHQLAAAFGIELDEAWALIKQARAGDAAAQAKIDGALGKLKARFGAAAAEVLGVDHPDAAWAIVEKAKHGDHAARHQLGAAATKAFNAAAAAAAAAKPPAGGAEPAPAAALSLGASTSKTCGAGGHPMVVQALPANWCDCCGAVGTAFRCASGCDYDLCAKCAAAADPPANQTPAAAATAATAAAAELPAQGSDLEEACFEYYKPGDILEITYEAGSNPGSTRLVVFRQLVELRHKGPGFTATDTTGTTKCFCIADVSAHELKAHEGSGHYREWHHKVMADVGEASGQLPPAQGSDFGMVVDVGDAVPQPAVASAEVLTPPPPPAAAPAAPAPAAAEAGLFEFPEGLAQLVGVMGFEQGAAKAALLAHGGDVREAVTQLIG